MIAFMHTRRRSENGEILPPDESTVRWHDRVNRGARFWFSPKDFLTGQHDQFCLRLPLAEPNEESFLFDEIAYYLYNATIGAVLCLSDGDVSEEAERFALTYGDVVDYLQTGRLNDRVACTPPWGYPEGALQFPSDGSSYPEIVDPQKLVGLMYEPNHIILPKGVRWGLQRVFNNIGAKAVGVSLFPSGDGRQFLWITYQPSDSMQISDASCHQIAQAVFWYLPRHYAAMIAPNSNVMGFPLI